MDKVLDYLNSVDNGLVWGYDPHSYSLSLFTNNPPPIQTNPRFNIHAIVHESEYGLVIALVLAVNGKNVSDHLIDLTDDDQRSKLLQLSQNQFIDVVYLDNVGNRLVDYYVINSRHHQAHLQVLASLEVDKTAVTDWDKAVESYRSQPTGIW